MDILAVCQKCRGTGEVSSGAGSGTTTCDRCNGSGRLDQGEISSNSGTLSEKITDINDKLNDIMNKCNDIFEKLNEQEEIMAREAICPTCHTEVEIETSGRCKVCGHQILEAEKPVEKPKKKK